MHTSDQSQPPAAGEAAHTPSPAAAVAGHTPTPWTVKEAQSVLSRSAPLALEYGYCIALFGSVARNGRGRDLDVMAVAIHPKVDGPQFLARLADCLGESICEGTANAEGAHISWGEDRWIDVRLADARAGNSVERLERENKAMREALESAEKGLVGGIMLLAEIMHLHVPPGGHFRMQCDARLKGIKDKLAAVRAALAGQPPQSPGVNAGLVEALKELNRIAKITHRRGASTGPHWVELAGATIKADAALSTVEKGGVS